MSQHHTRNTTGVMKYCSTCRRNTMHRVDDRREGSCTEHGAPELSKAQEKQRDLQEQKAQQPGLF